METPLPPPEARPFPRLLARLVLLAGLLIYVGVQGALVNVPLWQRAMPPELDDSVTYVLKTKLMQEGLFRVSPALADLRQQLFVPPDNPEATRERDLTRSRIFPVYHPLFSVMLIGLNKLGFDLMTAFKVAWSLGPLIFGLALAYLLTSLFGAGAAGLALILLAFAVFPDTGLHYVVPSNLAMAVAVVIWARLVSRHGRAPWTLALGSLALAAMHPIGLIYAIMSVVLALLLAEGKDRVKIFWPTCFVVSLVMLVLLVGALVKNPFVPNLLFMPGGHYSLVKMWQSAVASWIQVVSGVVKSGGGLFGPAPIFCAAIALGIITLSPDRRRPVLTILAINLSFLLAILFYVSTHPADVFLRLWIPAVAILYGLVGQALALTARLSWESWQNFRQERASSANRGWQLLWPLVLAAFLAGYVVQVAVKGGEVIVATTRYMQDSQPLDFSPRQPQMLLSRARPQDKVFYNSIIIMPYYFINGASCLGAVYYHPAFQGTAGTAAWLGLPELRFAVTYNPLVYHPSFAGVPEPNWWINSPDFYFSPLNAPRTHGPLAKDGQLAAADFSWLELEVRTRDFPKLLKIKLTNPGGPATLTLIPMADSGTRWSTGSLTAPVPARWSGEVTLTLTAFPGVSRFRLVLPPGKPLFKIQGITFGEDRLLWPWSQKARLTLMPREGPAEITVSFDPADQLPSPINSGTISVLDDQGSSVLFQLRP